MKPQDFVNYLLNPTNLPGLQEWKDVEELQDGSLIKYCKVKAPMMAARDHCWKYTIDKVSFRFLILLLKKEAITLGD